MNETELLREALQEWMDLASITGTIQHVWNGEDLTTPLKRCVDITEKALKSTQSKGQANAQDRT